MSTFDYQRLDDVIHSRIRLAIVSILSGVEAAEFTYLRDRTGATDGNLGAHLRKLEEAGYVEVEKRFEARKPVSSYALTAGGREAFRRYVDRLEAMINNSNN